MSNFLFPVLDGIVPSWADINLNLSPIGGSLLQIGDVSAISGGWTVDVGVQKEGGRIIATTTGELSLEASMTLYASGWNKLLVGMRDQMPLRGNQRLVSLAHFNISLLWTPPGSPLIKERRYKGVRIISNKEDSAEGTDAQQVELGLHAKEIVDVIDGVEYAAI